MQNLIKSLEQQEGLDRITKLMSDGVRALSGRSRLSRRLTEFVRVHPIHPALTDVPVGAWSTAAVLDLVAMVRGRRSRGAGSAIGVGILGAVPTALTGLIDWSHVDRRTQRLGVVHAALNSLALTCYLASLVSRLRGGNGRLVALLGMSLVGTSAYIGRYLVFRKAVGVIPEEQDVAGLLSPVVDMDGELAERRGELPRPDIASNPVDRASWESFPASDPPAWMGR